MLFLLWLCHFILSGVISQLISSSRLGTYRPGEFIFQCPIFLPFNAVHGVLKARILKWYAIPFSSGPHFVRDGDQDHPQEKEMQKCIGVIVKAMVFPVVLYRYNSWSIKKAEHQRFELWCWRRLLRVLYTARRSNQSILKEISP